MTVGTVVRLQVQRSRLKPGPPTTRVYDPSPLLEVEALDVGPRGCTGVLGTETFLDVHHADHADTRNRKLDNCLSLLPVTAYAALQERYGPHLVTGIVGESVLLDMSGPWPAGDLLLETDGEPLLLTKVEPAPPCVEFSRFCLGLDPGPVGDDVKQALVDLDGGARGYYARVTGEGRVTLGARLSLSTPR
ncbi:MAG: hypothetical protein JWM40_2056 [Frankiales bacterium]|nr:hypothetical protein [Frankiales bacterium]